MLETILQTSDKSERCGLILKDDSIVEVTNIADDPVNGYLMDPIAVLPYLTDDSVKGTWHTHPSGSPVLSGRDMEGFMGWPDLEHHVIGWVNGKVKVVTYRIEDGAIIRCD